MNEELREELNNLIESQVKRVKDGLGVQSDLVILKDLRRMSEMGVLQIKRTEIDCIKSGDKFSAICRLGLFSVHEETISELQKEVERLKAELKGQKEELKTKDQ